MVVGWVQNGFFQNCSIAWRRNKSWLLESFSELGSPIVLITEIWLHELPQA